MSELSFIACAVQQVPCPESQQRLLSFSDLVVAAVATVEPSEILAAYAFGAASVVTWWGLGFAISVATRAIGKA